MTDFEFNDSHLRRGLFASLEAGERERKGAEDDGNPLPIVPRALTFFSFSLSGSLCGGEKINDNIS